MFDHIWHKKAIFHKGFRHFRFFISCKMTAVLCSENRRFLFSLTTAYQFLITPNDDLSANLITFSAYDLKFNYYFHHEFFFGQSHQSISFGIFILSATAIKPIKHSQILLYNFTISYSALFPLTRSARNRLPFAFQ